MEISSEQHAWLWNSYSALCNLRAPRPGGVWSDSHNVGYNVYTDTVHMHSSTDVSPDRLVITNCSAIITYIYL